MRLTKSLICLAVAVVSVGLAGPAAADTFTLRCTMQGEASALDFLFDTNSKVILQRRVTGGVQLAKYQLISMTYAEVVFGKYALIGVPTQRYKVGRSGGPLYESHKKAGWSNWKPVGTCTPR